MNWDEFWSDLQRLFCDVANDVKAGSADVASAAGRTRSEAFPFGAYLSFGLENDPTREDVVISVDCKDAGQHLVLTCDIARGDGYVLADGPTLTVERTLVSSGDFADWLAAVSAFLEAQVDVMKREFSAKP